MSKDKYGFKIGYRIKWEDKPEYLKIKEFIVEDLHGDLCFIQWSLLRAFFNGMNKHTNPEKIELKFLRQNIQLNIGCTINYNRLKARRLKKDPPVEPPIEMRKDRLLPMLIEQWSTLSKAKKQFWTDRLRENGIIPPLISTRKAPDKPKKFKLLWAYCLTIVSKVLSGVGLELRRKKKRGRPKKKN